MYLHVYPCTPSLLLYLCYTSVHTFYNECHCGQHTYLVIAQLTLGFRSSAVLSFILGPARRSALNKVYSCT